MVQYEAIHFDDIHRDVAHLFPKSPSRVVDVGAGSGRDAAALARLGHRVVAVEPTTELRMQGQALHAARAIDWIDDSLPDLDLLRHRADQFDLILLTAVWMHLDQTERARGMLALKSLVAREGQIIMSLRHGPVPAGRRMFDVSATETEALALRHGLRVNHVGTRSDQQGRADVSWTVIGLRSGV
jgi:SAM-dependent methyltransferase